MRTIFSFVLSSLILVATTTLADGGDSSAGGGGGSLSLSSGLNSGKFDVSAFSKTEGFLGTVLKYYVLAGAVRHENERRIWYVMSEQESNHAIIQAKDDDTPLDQLQLNFNIEHADLLQYRTGCGAVCQTVFEFRGALANDIYRGMEASELEPVGWYNNPNNPREITGYIYREGGLSCDAGGVSGTFCRFVIDLAHNP